jgi:CRP-like cAMP-binding protein
MAISESALKRYGADAERRDNPLGIDNFFSKKQFTRLEELMYPKRAEAGSYLFWEGDPTGKLYYIKSSSSHIIEISNLPGSKNKRNRRLNHGCMLHW